MQRQTHREADTKDLNREREIERERGRKKRKKGEEEYKQLIRKEGGDWAWKDCNETGGGGRLEAIQWQGARRGVCCRQGAKAGDTVICVLSVH